MARDDDDNGFAQWGGYMGAKITKLEEQFSAASDPFRKSNIFAGISIFVNGLTNPSADELKRIMMVHGGIYHHYERTHTSFIIAANLPDVKVRNMNTSKIISAQWVLDCLKEQRVLDYKPYLLYTNQKKTQPRLQFGKGKKADVSATASMAEEEPQEQLGGILKELQQAAVAAEVSPPATKTKADQSISINSNAARTAVDPAFLSEFYKKSRLHHIATLGTGFKQYVCELRQAHGKKPFEKRLELKSLLVASSSCSDTATPRHVMHIDMDCFFVSVGLKKHPELQGLPIAVTHSKGGSSATEVPVHPQADRRAERELFAQRFEHQLHDNVRADKVRSGFEEKMSLSEIASCSYEARAKGIKNGMFVGQALKLCPELKTIDYDFEGYREVAFTLYDTVAQYTLNIEAVSCDEMFVELTDLVHELQIDVMQFVGHLRREMLYKTGCPCSAGVAGNKLLARMATKVAKPNGQHLLASDNVPAYMASTVLDALPGVGHGMTHKLNQAGFETCGDAQRATLEQLETLLGKKSAQTLYQNCRGIDPRPLVYEQQRKSVSAEVNYGIRFAKAAECETFLRQLCDEVHSRLIEIKRKTKCITLKLMVRAADAPLEASKFMGHGVCDNQAKSVSLKHSSDDLGVITTHVLSLMKQSGVPPQELRGIGIGLSKLDEAGEEKKENAIKKMFGKISEKQKAEKPAAIEMDELSSSKRETVENETKAKPRNVLDMMKSAAARKSMEEKKKHPADIFMDTSDKPLKESSETMAQFDPEILAQLPEDIRREVLTFKVEYLRIAEGESEIKKPKRRAQPLTPPQPAKAKAMSLVSPLLASDYLPSTSKAAVAKQQERAKRKEHEMEMGCKPDQIVIESENMLLNGNYKFALAAWVNGYDKPQSADRDLVQSSICELIDADQTDHIYEVMKYLCRLIKSRRGASCIWHNAYSHIESNIQTKMFELQGCVICLTESISCMKCIASDNTT